MAQRFTVKDVADYFESVRNTASELGADTGTWKLETGDGRSGSPYRVTYSPFGRRGILAELGTTAREACAALNLMRVGMRLVSGDDDN